MPDRLFPRWCGALFALLPLSEILYLPADAQSLYAAAAACAAAGLLAAGAARLSSAVAARPGVQLLHALSGLNVCAMWALPAVFLAGAVAVLSGVLTAGELRLSRLAAPTAALLPQFWSLLRLLLPGTLILALSLRDSSLAGAASRGLTAGGALLALLSLRTVLLLGPHTAALLPYPNFSAAGLAAIGDFARHGEVFFAVPLILCETGRCAALMSVILRVLPKRRS